MPAEPATSLLPFAFCLASLRYGAASLPPLGALQVQAHPFAVDQHEALVDQLLPGAVVLFVTRERSRGKDELHGHGSRSRPSRGPDAGAEIDPVEIRPRLEGPERRADQMRDVLIKR